MITIKSKTGTKAVNIITTSGGSIKAIYVDVYNGMEQVLSSKSFKNNKGAEKWAAAKLN